MNNHAVRAAASSDGGRERGGTGRAGTLACVEESGAPGEILRKATLSDIGAMLELVNGYAHDGVMLPRTEFDLSENIRDFTVAYAGGRLMGCAALHFYSPQMAEVRSLAVRRDAKGTGVGRRLVEALVEEAREYGLDALFAFTYVPGFFARVGFSEVERGLLPLKAWKDCLRCPKFSSCDEIAVLRVLDAGHWEKHHGAAGLEPGGEETLLPILKRLV